MSLTNDKLGHHHAIVGANALMAAGVVESGFENVGLVYVNNFIGSGESSLCRVYFGETVPGTNYSSVVKGGDEYHMLTYSSNLVTTKHKYVYQLGVFRKYLTDYIPIVDSIAITAEAGSDWHGMRIKSRAATGAAITGTQTGLYIETELTGTATCSGPHYGLKIETYVVSTATLSSDHYGAGIFTYDDRAGSNQLHVLRLEHNGANVANAFLGCFNADAKMSYFLESSTTEDDWVNITETASPGAHGWIKIKLGGYTKYIALCDSVS